MRDRSLPGALQVVRLVAAVQGMLGLAFGGATFARWHAHGFVDTSGDALFVVAAMQVLFSVAVVACGALLGRFSHRARVALTCLEALNAAAVLSLVLTPVSVLSLLLDALVVLALWLPEVTDAFGEARPG